MREQARPSLGVKPTHTRDLGNLIDRLDGNGRADDAGDGASERDRLEMAGCRVSRSEQHTLSGPTTACRHTTVPQRAKLCQGPQRVDEGLIDAATLRAPAASKFRDKRRVVRAGAGVDVHFVERRAESDAVSTRQRSESQGVDRRR